MNTENLERIDKVIKNKNGEELTVVRFYRPNKLLVWKDMTETLSDNKEQCYSCNVNEIPVDELKRINIWDKIDNKLQKELEENNQQAKIEVVNKMEYIRSHRRNKYENIPKEITCTKCNASMTIQPSILVKRAENISKKKGIIFTVDDYIKDYQCQKCRPTKGRRTNPNLPAKIELVCKCGYKVIYPHSIVKKQAEKKNLTIEKYVAGYQCQKCNPTKGRHKKAT